MERRHVHYKDTVHPMPGARVYQRMKDVPPVRTWMADVMAFVPVYLNGNACLVVTSNEELMYIPCRAQRMRQHLANYNTINSQLLRSLCQQEMGASLNIPLLLPKSEIIYGAFKVRKPMTRNDGATGYFRLQDVVDKFSLHDGTTELWMGETLSFHLDMSIQSVYARIRDSRNVEAILERRGRRYTY